MWCISMCIWRDCLLIVGGRECCWSMLFCCRCMIGVVWLWWLIFFCVVMMIFCLLGMFLLCIYFLGYVLFFYVFDFDCGNQQSNRGRFVLCRVLKKQGRVFGCELWNYRIICGRLDLLIFFLVSQVRGIDQYSIIFEVVVVVVMQFIFGFFLLLQYLLELDFFCLWVQVFLFW